MKATLEAKELRIGNWVMTTPNNIFQVSSDEYKNWEVNGMWANPIPLTEEWLEKLGFIWNKELNGYEKSGFTPMLRKPRIEGARHTMVIGLTMPIYRIAQMWHVHQLQNLYFALTGEELKQK